MKISPITSNRNFGRAFTTEEKASYTQLLDDAKDTLNIQDTTAIVFDFNVPSEKGYNTGIGTTFSDSMKKFASFLQTMTGISSIQLQPQGKISTGNKSPYSGTNFAYGEHIIDLKKLASEEYASLLSIEDIKNADKQYPRDKVGREYRTDYNYVIGQNGIQEKLLRKAYDNFVTGLVNADVQILELNDEFEAFKKENNSWLEKEALFGALTTHYSTSDISKWEERDRNLYSKTTNSAVREERIAELKEKYSDSIGYENFKQFIASKQQGESRAFLNAENIKLYGDCLIGFSQSDMWSNIDCFRENLYYGGPDPGATETNGIQTWGLPALDYTKLGECDESGDLSKLGDVGKFLYDKYTTIFKRYDGIRMDAAWQFVTPFVYQDLNGKIEEVEMPEIEFTIFNIMKAAAKNVYGDKFDEHNPENIMLELLGISSDKSRAMTINTYPHLYTTEYAEYDESPKKFLEKGYQQGKFYAGVGCHDNQTIVNLAKDTEKRRLHIYGMKRDYSWRPQELEFSSPKYQQMQVEEKREEKFRTAKLAEVFTSIKQFFTLPDMFGMAERINISGKADDKNWSVRIPSDYERFYFSQLSNGYGMNMPKILVNAMSMNGIKNDELMEKCREAAEILRSDGPMTEQEANEADRNGKLVNKFEYIS